MPESMLEKVINDQVEAQKGPIKSLMENDGPIWLEASTGAINEPILCSIIIDKHSLVKTGRVIRGSNGAIVTPDAIKKFIADEIGPYIPTNTARKVDPIYKLMVTLVPQEKKRAKAISGAELKSANLKAPDLIIDGLLPCGLCVLAAPPKTGKSWLCLEMADAVSTGGPFWGRKTVKGDVLYLALEDSEYRLKQRLIMINSAFMIDFLIRGVRKLDNGLVDDLREWLNEHTGAKMIIVDTLARVKGAGIYGLNGYEADTQQFAPLQELAVEKGVSIVLVTHFSKSKGFTPDDPFERISGTSGLFGVSDVAWIIDGKRNSDEMNLIITGRDAIGGEYKIKQNGVIWQMIGDSQELEDQRTRDNYKVNPIVKTIIQLVTEGNRWMGTAQDLQREIMTRTGQIGAATVKELGTRLYELQGQLLEYDGIMFLKGPGGRRGRGYVFEKVG